MLQRAAFILIVVILVTQMIISFNNKNKPREILRFDRLGTGTSSLVTTRNATTMINDKIKIDRAPVVINLVASSHQFTPSIIKAKIGIPLKIRILSKGDHNFSIDELGVDIDTPNNENTEVLFIPDKTGTFFFYSANFEDRSAGMTGKLIVK